MKSIISEKQKQNNLNTLYNSISDLSVLNILKSFKQIAISSQDYNQYIADMKYIDTRDKLNAKFNKINYIEKEKINPLTKSETIRELPKLIQKQRKMTPIPNLSSNKSKKNLTRNFVEIFKKNQSFVNFKQKLTKEQIFERIKINLKLKGLSDYKEIKTFFSLNKENDVEVILKSLTFSLKERNGSKRFEYILPFNLFFLLSHCNLISIQEFILFLNFNFKENRIELNFEKFLKKITQNFDFSENLDFFQKNEKIFAKINEEEFFLTINPAKVEFNLKEKETKTTFFLENETILKIIQNEFVCWEHFILDSCKENKSFNEEINKIFSEFNKESLSNDVNEDFLNKNSPKNAKREQKVSKHLKENITMFYFDSDLNFSFLLEYNPFEIFVRSIIKDPNQKNNEISETFKLSLEQTKKILSLYKKSVDINEFIIKSIELKEGKMSLNLEFLNKMNSFYVDCLNSPNSSLQNKENSILKRKNENHLNNNFNISVKVPYLVFKFIDEFDKIEKETKTLKENVILDILFENNENHYYTKDFFYKMLSIANDEKCFIKNITIEHNSIEKTKHKESRKTITKFKK